MTLKVGDKVRRNGSTRPWSTGVVTAVEGKHVEVLPDGYRYGASCADTPGAGTFELSQVEKIEEQPRPLGLESGDKVVNLRTGREGLVLNGPISGELKVYDTKPPIRDAVPAQALEEYEFHFPGTYDVWRRAAVPW